MRYGREPEKGRNPESWSSHRGVEKRGYREGVSSYISSFRILSNKVEDLD